MSTNILLIDDEEAFVSTLAERMELRGLRPQVALNGARGLELLRESVPDIVILDLRMPGMTGTDVLQKIKRQHPQLPVIILSGHGSKADLEGCIALGAAACLRKPLEISVLLENIQALTTRSS